MANITQRYPLNIVPEYWIKTHIFLNRMDEGMTLLNFPVYSLESRVDLSGMSVVLSGMKTDGTTYTYSCGIGSDPETGDGETDYKIAYITVQEQMTIEALNSEAELTISDSSGNVVHTANFTVHVEETPTEGASEPSSSELTVFQQLLVQAQAVAAQAQSAAETIESSTTTAVEAAASASADAQTAATAAASAEEDLDYVSDVYGRMQYQMENEITARENGDAALDARIDELILEAEGEAATVDSELIDIRVAANGTTYATAGTSVRTQINELQSQIDNGLDELQYEIDQFSIDPDDLGLYQDPDTGYVYPTYQGVQSENGIPLAASGGGGGGGSSNNATFTASNTTGWNATTISSGADCIVYLTWSSTENGLSTGNGTIRITVDSSVKATYSITQGTVSVNLASYLTAGNHTVKIRISDVYDNGTTFAFSISVVELTITSTFDVSTPFTGAITFPYVLSGAITKTVHFVLDGSEIDTLETSVYGRAMNFTIPAQSHGAHTFVCYFTATVNSETVSSNRLYYNFMATEDGETDPIIVSQYTDTTATQYATIQIPYIVYTPGAETSAVTITANGTTMASLTVDATEHTFSYQINSYGTLTIVITSGTTSKTFVLTVEESDIDVEAETTNLALYLTSNGRSNNEETPGTWTYGNISATMTNFNYTSDGWLADDDGITVLRVGGNARVTIPYQPFASDFRSTGKTIEIEFATRDVLDYDATIMSCIYTTAGNRDIGLKVTAQKATLTSEQSTISTQYKEDEHVRIAFVCQKRSENRLLFIYINGIMSGVVQYPDGDDFSQATPANISIGSSSCTMDIYCIRVYDNNLTPTQVVNNWIADTRDGATMLARYTRNNIYDAYGQIVISQLPSDLPYLILNASVLPQYKGDKKTITGSYTDPTNSARSFTFSGAQIDVQGTSSAGYARKNYKVKFKSGFLMSGGALVTTYQLTEDCVATNTFCFKADVASSEGANNVELVRLYCDACPYETPAQEENALVRQGIDGFPIVIFWNDGTDTTFLG